MSPSSRANINIVMLAAPPSIGKYAPNRASKSGIDQMVLLDGHVSVLLFGRNFVDKIK